MPLRAADYRPRDAEHAVLYRVIAEHLTLTDHPCRGSWNKSSEIS